jgi:uncharacterized protein YndB with AHSA1/START domain
MSMATGLAVALKGEREIVISRAFAAAPAQVWRAHTAPDLVRRWMLGPPGWTMPVCEIDLCVGGRYRHVWRNIDGREMGLMGVYREIVAPSRLVTTELFDDDWTGGETLATLVLAAQGGGTLMTNTVRYAAPEARRLALGSDMERGMEAGYRLLDALLAGGG